ncbi:MAG TPA: ATP-binding cassette domain-containing protein [Brevundimonas sp.]|jgi:cell division transport system ATP-binding protein|uniref:ATP-binding cassette domain-containing protein n=1 Tax=Brevundimonas sp. TaxID=1871086 RepID=UPI002DE903B6|nr:ATP-binding cassette domain-containing protein [Brevundimonas sp.]
MPTTPTRRAPPAASATVARLSGVRVKGPARRGILDLTMPRGSFHFLTGPSGAGKSRALETLALARRPDDGCAVALFGTDPWSADEAGRATLRRRIGFAGRDGGLIDRLTVFQNAALPLALAGEADEGRAHVGEMLDWLGLAPVADRPAGTLDRARRRALRVARALVAQPELILIDDPLDDLTPEAADRVLGLLAALGKGEAAVVMTGRDPSAARKAGATVLTLDGAA